MTGYPHPRNTSVMHASGNINAVRPLSLDERRADWASKFYARGLHRGNGKPRIRVAASSPLPTGAQPTDSPSRADRAGRQSIPAVPAPEDQAGWDDYMRRACAGEFVPF